uniref:RING-type domain-containing protein n=1 Tax=Leptobrachium leishanense TaxID=445787 RepID=A0A8C5MDI0_9ANUR
DTHQAEAEFSSYHEEYLQNFFYRSFPCCLFPAIRMASADLRYELTCSICMDVYMDPVTLMCGHSFCQFCIGDKLESQKRSGSKVYACPECRMRFQECPILTRNDELHKKARSFLDIHPKRIFCTYCIQVPPTSSLENQKWPSDKKDPDYSLFEDATCNSTTCSLAGERSVHQVETLNETHQNVSEMFNQANPIGFNVKNIPGFVEYLLNRLFFKSAAKSLFIYLFLRIF